jgi:hypothetical protein
MAMLGKMQRDAQIFYAWNDRFSAWLEAQFVYCLPADKQIGPMPLFPKKSCLKKMKNLSQSS